MAETVRALMLGDLYGSSGLRAFFSALPRWRQLWAPDLVVVNAENAAEGYGLRPDQAEALFAAGVDVVTSGNHIWEVPELRADLDRRPALLRPQNYGTEAPGRGWCRVERAGRVWTVINLQGRQHLPAIEDPFSWGTRLAEEARAASPLILVDFHAEAGEEKEALAWHLDGLVSAVVGTHTHTPTADTGWLPKGTLFQADLGFCGPRDSIIGAEIPESLRRARTQLPIKVPPASGPAVLQGLRLDLDPQSGRVLAFERIHEVLAPEA